MTEATPGVFELNPLCGGDLESSMPIPPHELTEGGWYGSLILRKGGDRGIGVFLLASVSPDAGHPGFVNYTVTHNASKYGSIRPVRPFVAGVAIDLMLAPHGVKCSDLKWEPDDGPCTSEDIVYFLGAGPFVKIGKATGSANARVSALQTGCPYPIEVLFTKPGGFKLERNLHRRFAAHHAHGEWFHRRGELTEFVARHSRKQTATRGA